MQSHSIKEAIEKQYKIFDKTADDPVFLTQESKPSHVLLSADAYQQLLNRLEELENILLTEAANNDDNETKLVLSERDSKHLISVMENPPEPSEGLISLFD
ncbi:MAG: type II toxin-antitoxin system Phd/YefM family antitoxin [Scytonematopsis contorta HA4267-MV1]|jgi:PHD/YefM family antitoxin component YafN of YafNO toxin-antitoxin module|nr:type II toxin-antitoxin system Phd/YefM family antitoxin [Scytonematopsis contorta HA4267-MV1]